MVLSGRRSRGISTGTWLVVGIVVTLLVLVVDASIKSRSPNQVKTLSTQAWVDQVLPILGETISQGDEVNQIRTEPVTSSALTVLPALQGVANNAAQALTAARALKPPVSVAGPNGLLLTCLQTRVLGAETVSEAMTAALTGSGGNPIAQLQTASQQFQVADEAYALFLQDMPPVGVHLPTSVWLSDPGDYTAASLTTYVQALRNARSPVPVHDLQVEAVTTMPPAVSVRGQGASAVQVLPQSQTLTVVATVGNIGNQTESDVLLVGSLHPSAVGYSGQFREYVSLQQGQSTTVTLPAFRPPIGVPVTLVVTIGPVNGETNTDDTKSIEFVMPSSNSVPPTSATTSTTIAGSGSSESSSGSSGSGTTTTGSTTSTTG
jgi:hypothetical protein